MTNNGEKMRSLAIAGMILQILGFTLFGWILIRILMIISGDSLWIWWEPFLFIIQGLVAKFMTSTGLNIHLDYHRSTGSKGETYD